MQPLQRTYSDKPTAIENMQAVASKNKENVFLKQVTYGRLIENPSIGWNYRADLNVLFTHITTMQLRRSEKQSWKLKNLLSEMRHVVLELMESDNMPWEVKDNALLLAMRDHANTVFTTLIRSVRKNNDEKNYLKYWSRTIAIQCEIIAQQKQTCFVQRSAEYKIVLESELVTPEDEILASYIFMQSEKAKKSIPEKQQRSEESEKPMLFYANFHAQNMGYSFICTSTGREVSKIEAFTRYKSQFIDLCLVTDGLHPDLRRVQKSEWQGNTYMPHLLTERYFLFHDVNRGFKFIERSTGREVSKSAIFAKYENDSDILYSITDNQHPDLERVQKPEFEDGELIN